MSTYGYVRVSTKPQTEGDSLEVQERMVQGRALQDGLKLTHVFVERGVSGARRLQDRPQGKALLDVLKAGDSVIASKLDRCFRSASDALDVLVRLKAQKVSLILLDLGGDVTGSGVASLIFSILAAVAEFERQRIGDRVAEMKEHEKSVGKYRGGKRPFGYRPNEARLLEPVPEEAAGLSLILKLAGDGVSLRKIQAALADSLGVKLSHVAINRVVRDAKVRKPASASAA